MGKNTVATLWWKWLFTASIYFIIVGIVIAFFPHSRLLDIVLNDSINEGFWPNGLPTGVKEYQAWLYGVLGTTIIGWGVTMGLIARTAFRRAEKWSWWALFLGMTTWFIPDTVISISYGINRNVVFNILLYVLMLIPLLGSVNSIFKASTSR